MSTKTITTTNIVNIDKNILETITQLVGSLKRYHPDTHRFNIYRQCQNATVVITGYNSSEGSHKVAQKEEGLHILALNILEHFNLNKVRLIYSENQIDLHLVDSHHKTSILIWSNKWYDEEEDTNMPKLDKEELLQRIDERINKYQAPHVERMLRDRRNDEEQQYISTNTLNVECPTDEETISKYDTDKITQWLFDKVGIGRTGFCNIELMQGENLSFPDIVIISFPDILINSTIKLSLTDDIYIYIYNLMLTFGCKKLKIIKEYKTFHYWSVDNEFKCEKQLMSVSTRENDQSDSHNSLILDSAVKIENTLLDQITQIFSYMAIDQNGHCNLAVVCNKNNRHPIVQIDGYKEGSLYCHRTIIFSGEDIAHMNALAPLTCLGKQKLKIVKGDIRYDCMEVDDNFNSIKLLMSWHYK